MARAEARVPIWRVRGGVLEVEEVVFAAVNGGAAIVEFWVVEG